MFDFTKLWDRAYLFGPNPSELSRSDNIFFWVSVAFLAIGIIAKILVSRSEIGSPTRFLYARFFHVFITMGILILLWAGARFENIPWISAHVTVLFLFLVLLVWLSAIAKYFIQKFGTQQKAWNEEKIKRKYLPS